MLRSRSSRGLGRSLRTALARDLKGEISPALYAAAIPLAFVREWIAAAIYVMVALTCLVPDRRIESRFHDSASSQRGRVARIEGL
jgi:TMEM175 potassium channel family protein